MNKDSFGQISYLFGGISYLFKRITICSDELVTCGNNVDNDRERVCDHEMSFFLQMITH